MKRASIKRINGWASTAPIVELPSLRGQVSKHDSAFNSKQARVPTFIFLLACAALWSSSRAAAQEPPAPPLIVQELNHDVSPPLRDIRPIPPSAALRQIPLLRPSLEVTSGPLLDPLLQTTLGPSVATTAGQNFDGVGKGFAGPQGTFSVSVAPPDTNGAVGDKQYVQFVNTSFAVFDKTTGSVLYGPAAGSTLWSGFSGACSSTNDGDVIAQYDKLANRWIMTQLSFAKAPPYLLCVALSTSDDATGSYYRFSLSYSGVLNDYPKLGVWPDAYYVTANMFQPVQTLGCLLGISSCFQYQGPEVCALHRSSMLTGGSSSPVCEGPLGTSYSSLLPSDLDGTNPPPAGSPNYLLSLGGSGVLDLWKFHVDFVSPSNSTLTGPTRVLVASYSEACGGGTCIPQNASTQQLDSLGDRLMYRLGYRNMSGTEILVANHSVATVAGGSSTVGIRWYEIHNPNGSPAVYQAGTWAPDASFRWMGSIAMDHVGDIALGYSVSSSSIYPGIRYTGHRPGVDALGVMESENSIVEGTGSQQPSLNRWGDYSAMTVDPVDDCTFWYTNEYLKANGTFNWSTRIASFVFPSCTAGLTAPNFSLTPSPTSQSATTQGGGNSYTIAVASLNSYSGTVNLTVSSCPATLTCGLTSASVSVPSGGTATSTLNVSTSGSTTAGDYTITVTGTDSSGSPSHQTSVTLTVTDFALGSSPSTATVSRGSSATYNITARSLDGFAGTVNLSVASCPVGLTCGLSLSSVSVPAGGTSNASTLTVGTTGSTPTGGYSITVSATSGTISHMATVTLQVNAPSPGNFSISASPASASVSQGSTAKFTVTITPSGGFTGTVGLTASGCPTIPSPSCSFSPPSISAGSGTSTLAVATTSGTPFKSFNITITGASGSSTHSASVTLVVF
jgi:hypothetical protein